MKTTCDFTFRGKPRTQPGTEDDEKRIALSQRLTSILVAYGDEKKGDYVTPGAETSAPPLPKAPPFDEWALLRERFAGFRKKLGQAKKEIDGLLRQLN